MRSETHEAVQRLSALGGGELVVRRAIVRLLLSMPPSETTRFLQEVQALARQHWLPAMTVLPAVTRALELEPELVALSVGARRVAALDGETAVELLFNDAEAQLVYDEDSARRADAKLFSRPLGYLKQQARLTRNPDELAKLAVASNAAVVREVLKNPRLTEDLVVRIASRRPARPEPLTEIWRSARWSMRVPVRRALAFNPYLPVEVGSKLVPLLPRPDLGALAEDVSLHATLRVQAQQLLSMG
jgi:hypothetical protein